MIEKLAKWSQEEFFGLPWRKNRSLYGTLVSEIMLQQTTVATVVKHYERFLREYPNPLAVANASEERLLISWKGLGYYRRAKNLRKACSFFCERFNGRIPLDFEVLKSAPGIGDYTANALLAIGADTRALALDANLERVLARLYGIEDEKGAKLQKKLQKLFTEGAIGGEMSLIGSRNFHESLMDLGRNFCKANKASCSLCPLSLNCVGFKSGNPLSFPVSKEKAKKEIFDLTLLRLLHFKKGKLLVFKKNEKQWLAGQLEVPTFILESQDPKLEQYPGIDFENHHWLPEYKTLITKYRITNKVLVVNEDDLKLLGVEESRYQWRELNLKRLNLSTGSLKALELIK
ncbi:MAG: hypothetical protein WEB87_03650 [Bacteriovoracaceae bacterium]